MFLLDDILLAPITGFRFILRTLERVAEEQWTDDAPLKEQLLELQVELDQGQITEEEYVDAEARILRALREVQERKMALAGASPQQAAEGLSGQVGEGSGVSVNLDYGKTAPRR